MTVIDSGSVQRPRAGDPSDARPETDSPLPGTARSKGPRSRKEEKKNDHLATRVKIYFLSLDRFASLKFKLGLYVWSSSVEHDVRRSAYNPNAPFLLNAWKPQADAISV